MKIENLRDFVSTVNIPENFKLYKDIITIDYGTKKQGSEGISQIKVTFDRKEDKFKHKVVSCWCTKMDIIDLGELEQLINIGYNTKIKGEFTKQANLYDETKGKKQIIKLKGNIT